ncbi:rod shape-determining protein MreC [Stakelama sp. CBK3Z-3]|uniref:Cell shape-determining protein MreC n=1 Tax=Stakelama flava TaxID=2860338 RepID=A0ABS6XPG4_9SPHN|nr:rod shape-determining protein MreC [Stakelama flava]MBW4332102.1 rod shape-determining protein MreC [Stakelama flava]
MAPPRNRRPGFSRRAQYGLFLGYVIAAFGAVIAVVLLLLSTFNPGAFSTVRGAAREVTTPLSSGMDSVRGWFGSIPGAIGEHFGTVSENRKLKKQLVQARHVVQQARTLGRENRRLRALLKLRDRDTGTVAVARLVSSSASSTRRYAILNAGSRQGVRPSQPVSGPNGLIGRVLETGFNTARILLIIDPESIVPVQRTRDGLPAIVVGRGDGLVEVRSASVANAPFLSGDTFVTSGTGGIYPPNIPVARVIRNSTDSSLGRVFASPDTVDFALVQQVFMPKLSPSANDREAPRAEGDE